MLLRELNDVRSLADALRAQEHEFAHRLHVIAGLIELGRYEDAVGFISSPRSCTRRSSGRSSRTSASPRWRASARQGRSRVGARHRAQRHRGHAPAGGLRRRARPRHRRRQPRRQCARLGRFGGRRDGHGHDPRRARRVVVQVRDSGPGVGPWLLDEIFRDGFTTKVATGTGRRGLGLALVSRTVRRRRRLGRGRERRRRALHRVPAARRPAPENGGVIRTLVVDDDFMSASIHRSYVERVPGFEAVGEAHTGAEALEGVRRSGPTCSCSTSTCPT